MLQVKNLHFSIGNRQLLSGVNLTVQPGKRSALLGPNGAGKTTLLRILIGEIEYESGSIVKPRGYRIGYLPQEEIPVIGSSVLNTLLEARPELTSLEKKIETLHHSLQETGDRGGDILERVGELEQRYETLGGYDLEVLARKILSGLGFAETDFSRPLSHFSGGWQMRVHLARLLIRSPHLLLLDEPTNHLDLPALEWLEHYLFSFKGSMVIVSHDRFFIHRLAQEILHLERGRLEYYNGDYHFYEKKREQQEILMQKKYEEQRVERERQERFINRFRYKNTKATQVQSRIKQLEKLEKIELAPPPPRLEFNLKVETKSYKDVLKIIDMGFRYEENWILKDVNLDLSRGDRICLVGANGAGKTTLARLMVGQLRPQRGSLTWGERTDIGYYAQHQVDTLNQEATAYQEVASTVANSLIPRIRDVLGIFHFHGSDGDKKIKSLSGGEKARVSLVKILLSSANFLVMDEPTNHLDRISREALEKALVRYEGTLVLVSHDRYFLDKIVTRVVEIGKDHIEEYSGNYSYYVQKRGNRGENRAAGTRDDKPPISDGQTKKERKRREAEARQAVSQKRARLNHTIESLEKRIDKLETGKGAIEARMAKPETYESGALTAALQKEYAGIKKELGDCYRRWESAQADLDNLLEEINPKNHKFLKKS